MLNDTSQIADILKEHKDVIIQWFAKTLKQIKRWYDENKDQLISVRHICMFAAKSNKKIVLQKMYRDDKQQKTNEGNTEVIDTEKKQYNGNSTRLL